MTIRGAVSCGMPFGRNVIRSAQYQATRTYWILLLMMLSLAPHGGASAQVLVDCDDESDFCTGNPCTVSQELQITVAVCNLDFLGADLVINEKVLVPNNGTLILTAGSIAVNQKIDGKHTKATEPDGADVSLITTGNITIDKRIDVSGRDTVGSITLDAGGNIAVNRELRARARGSGTTAVGGTVDVHADGTLTTVKRGKTDVRGKKKVSAAGTASLSGDAGTSLKGRVEARGSTGGAIVIASTSGDVVIEEEMRAQGDPAGGGSVTVTAGGMISFQGKKGRGLATGAPGGSVTVTAVSDILLNNTLKARGRGASNGGTITVESTGGNIDSQRRVDVKSAKGNGGTMSFTGVNLVLGSAKEARGKSPGVGGTIEAVATNNLTVGGNFKATPGGCIGLSAGGILDTSMGTFDPPFQPSCP